MALKRYSEVGRGKVCLLVPQSFECHILDGAKGETQKSLLNTLADMGYITPAVEKKGNGISVVAHCTIMHIPTYGTKRVYAVKLDEA